MASKVMLLLAIIVQTAWAMPMENRIERDSNSPIFHGRSLSEKSTDPDPMKTSIEQVSNLGLNQRARKELEESAATFEKRSVRVDEKEEISENGKADETGPNENENESGIDDANQDDLETAAGTNILRPLFVYRQQLAYRERIRKAGRRRAVPNF